VVALACLGIASLCVVAASDLASSHRCPLDVVCPFPTAKMVCYLSFASATMPRLVSVVLPFSFMVVAVVVVVVRALVVVRRAFPDLAQGCNWRKSTLSNAFFFFLSFIWILYGGGCAIGPAFEGKGGISVVGAGVDVSC
jgi:hypothetical protein